MSTEIYLDIETSWQKEITLIGFWSKPTGLVQLINEQINATNLLKQLPSSGELFTFNGHSFDLSVIKNQLGIDLRSKFQSFDLRWICPKYGLKGGQKIVEKLIGFDRETEGLNGQDAIRLWAKYLQGDRTALKTFLQYNAEDIQGMIAIKKYLNL
jgi:uncharacterized protein